MDPARGTLSSQSAFNLKIKYDRQYSPSPITSWQWRQGSQKHVLNWFNPTQVG